MRWSAAKHDADATLILDESQHWLSPGRLDSAHPKGSVISRNERKPGWIVLTP